MEAKPEGLSGQSNHKPRLETFVDKYNVLMSSIASIFLMGFITVVMIQVISRTFLPKSPAWTEEVARYFFIYMVAFGASVAVHKKEFVGIDLLTVYFPDTINRLLEILINAGLLTLCWFLLLRSVLKFALIKYRMVSTALQINMKFIYFSMILLFGMLTLSYILEVILILKRKDG